MSHQSAPTADATAVREVRRRWASGVAVVLTRQDDGWRGATVSAFAVVSLEPPTVLVCLARDARMSIQVPESGMFTVSILDRGHEFLAERFAGRAPLVDAGLTGVDHAPAPSGLPVLAGALAWFDCDVSAVHDGGDHLVIIGQVNHVGAGEDTGDPLLYYEGRYRSISS
ncbi:MAG: flavin reductase family protein [Chloroflexota bacterium]|nr:flavin reductase family protein [Chloroflexota bacterium]